ncbi:hypothetical protein [Brevibacillus gelatini]|uniref:Uncharacterized protein n=1 Tax=Brevibacillus gelatini TaxID=1655277 RepID=A0A3M8BF42_9BACL|nr:hypothetical protein [Brevibacillus gelatini]RNB61982.1 hypothetical protein EDM57_00030 [Brevibacillus gelatini]
MTNRGVMTAKVGMIDEEARANVAFSSPADAQEESLILFKLYAQSSGDFTLARMERVEVGDFLWQ